MIVKKTEIQEVVALSYKITSLLSKDLARARKKAMEDREEVIELMKKKGVLSDVLNYLKEEADRGDRVSLNVFNFWKYGQFPELGNKGHGVSK